MMMMMMMMMMVMMEEEDEKEKKKESLSQGWHCVGVKRVQWHHWRRSKFKDDLYGFNVGGSQTANASVTH
jgi:hypothetical protein